MLGRHTASRGDIGDGILMIGQQPLQPGAHYILGEDLIVLEPVQVMDRQLRLQSVRHVEVHKFENHVRTAVEEGAPMHRGAAPRRPVVHNAKAAIEPIVAERDLMN